MDEIKDAITDKPMEAYPMNGGNDEKSYSKNSTMQKEVGDTIKPIMMKAIAEAIDITAFSDSKAFRIADLGCSIGPNTFIAAQNIIEAVKTGINESNVPEFHVFFNDHVSNDFNTLFRSLDALKSRNYYAAGVPGSFHGRLFPNSSLHFVHTSWSIQWLSKVPDEVRDKSHIAWNKGRIYYPNASKEVVKAFSDQHDRDMDKFLQARAQEILPGGLMVFILTSRSSGSSHTDLFLNKVYDALGDSLAKMVEKGLVDEEKLDSFNIPVYYPSPAELEESVARNGCFTIERNESIPHQMVYQLGPEKAVMGIRAVMEALITEHFGPEILDELFDIFGKKVAAEYFELASGSAVDIFMLLKRKPFP